MTESSVGTPGNEFADIRNKELISRFVRMLHEIENSQDNRQRSIGEYMRILNECMTRGLLDELCEAQEQFKKEEATKPPGTGTNPAFPLTGHLR